MFGNQNFYWVDWKILFLILSLQSLNLSLSNFLFSPAIIDLVFYFFHIYIFTKMSVFKIYFGRVPTIPGQFSYGNFSLLWQNTSISQQLSIKVQLPVVVLWELLSSLGRRPESVSITTS